jgi:hypothetical protein
VPYEGMHHEVVVLYRISDGAYAGSSVLDHAWQVPIHAANVEPGLASLVGSLRDYNTIGPQEMIARHLAQEAQAREG